MKTIIFIIAMLSLNAMAAEKPIEVCKSISKLTKLYACDIGPSVLFVSNGVLISTVPKSSFSQK